MAPVSSPAPASGQSGPPPPDAAPERALPVMRDVTYDQGINAAFLGYNLSGSRNHVSDEGSSQLQRSLYGYFTWGGNMGAWRLRGSANYSMYRESGGDDEYDDDGNYSEWQRGDTYLQRDIQSLDSDFSAGELSSGGEVFDSVPFRGIMLGTSEAMLPSDQRGFSPVITGVARTNAQVTVRQRGTIIWQSYVPPGPFRITDLPSTGNTGNLHVTIKEADGTSRHFTHSYSGLSVMQHEGGLRYEWVTGQYRDNGVTTGSGSAPFTQGTMMAGLPHELTLYGGLLYAEGYRSLALGDALSLGDWGALSTDMTLAQAQLTPDMRATGSRLRASYSRQWDESGISLDVTASLYPSANYYSFSDFSNLGYQLTDYAVPWDSARPYQSWQVNVTQSLDDAGSLSLNATHETFWNDNEVNNQLSFGYSTMVRQVTVGVNFSVDYEQDDDGNWQKNRALNLSLSVPFTVFSNDKTGMNTSGNYSYSGSSPGGSTHTLSLNGNSQKGWGYDVSQNVKGDGHGNSGNADMYTQGGVANGNIGYNYGDGQHGATYSLSGSLLATGHGVKAVQDVSNGAILVSVAHQPGVKLLSGEGTTDSNGYAVINSLQPYTDNTVTLDTSSLPDDIIISEPTLTLYPTRNAIAEADFTPVR